MAGSSHGYNFIQAAVGEDYYKIAAGVLAAAILLVLGYKAKSELKAKSNPLVPSSKLSCCALFEMIALFLVNLGDEVMGKERRGYLPFVATIFCFILCMNLLGLIPGMTGPTDAVYFNLGISIVVLTCYTYWGIRELGIFAYLRHMCGPIKIDGVGGLILFMITAPLIFPIEIISHLLRPMTLSIRLYGNMAADHQLLSVMTELTKAVVPVVFYFMGVFVSIVQAFVFAMLTMLYIRFATEHGEDEEQHH